MSMNKGIILLLALAVLVGSAMATAETATGSSTAQSTEGTDSNDMISLIDLNPSVLYGLARYPKYYADSNLDRDTIDAGLLGRQYLFGSLNGFRDELTQDGIFLNFGLTQVYQSVVSGDSDHKHNYTGSADVWFALDTGRMGLWSGGLIFSHFEYNWNDPVSGTGALLPIRTSQKGAMARCLA